MAGWPRVSRATPPPHIPRRGAPAVRRSRRQVGAPDRRSPA